MKKEISDEQVYANDDYPAAGPEFLLNNSTMEIHHIDYVKPQCRIDEIKISQKIVSLSLFRLNGGKLCGHCFGGANKD